MIIGLIFCGAGAIVFLCSILAYFSDRHNGAKGPQ